MTSFVVYDTVFARPLLWATSNKGSRERASERACYQPVVHDKHEVDMKASMILQDMMEATGDSAVERADGDA